MRLLIALIAPGVMGAAIARRLVERGAEVRSWLEGRSEDTIRRAAEAGIAPADRASLVEADMILSIVPPAQAINVAEDLAPLLMKSPAKPIYVDFNAINPDTVLKIAGLVTATGCDFIDGSIIGAPPRADYAGPVFYVAGPRAGEFERLSSYGLVIRVAGGSIGAASALKMCYGGITKGLIAVGSAMALAAMRAGVGPLLHSELMASQPQLMTGFGRSIPDMFAKANRWIAEMEQIAGFLSEASAERDVYDAIAAFYKRIGADFDGDWREIGILETFLHLRDEGLKG